MGVYRVSDISLHAFYTLTDLFLTTALRGWHYCHPLLSIEEIEVQRSKNHRTRKCQKQDIKARMRGEHTLDACFSIDATGG